MANEKAVEAIILRVRPYRNTSAIITALTEDDGKCVFMARGIRRFSRKRDFVDLGYYGQLSFLLRPDSDMQLLTDFELYDDFYFLRRAERPLMLAQQVIRLVERLTVDNNPDPWLFDLLKSTLSVLETSDGHEIFPWFLLRFIVGSGFASGRYPQGSLGSLIKFMQQHSIHDHKRLKMTPHQAQGLLAYAQDVIQQTLHINPLAYSTTVRKEWQRAS